MGKNVRIPTEEEIAQLPRWAQVAFAARCARRAQPLFSFFWPAALKEDIDAIDKAITLAEQSAAAVGTDDITADDVAANADTTLKRSKEEFKKAGAWKAAKIIFRVLQNTKADTPYISYSADEWDEALKNTQANADAAYVAAIIASNLPAAATEPMRRMTLQLIGQNANSVAAYISETAVIEAAVNAAIAAHTAARAAYAIRAAYAAYTAPNAASAASSARSVSSLGIAFAVYAAANIAATPRRESQYETWDSFVIRTVRNDFDKLLTIAKKEIWDDNKSVPPEFFGPMWPEGTPKGQTEMEV